MSLTQLDIATIPEALSGAASGATGITLVDRNLSEQRLSWSDLRASARSVAADLSERGVQKGDRVCLLSPTNPELLTALFGTWEAGAVPVVLPLPRRINELQVFVDDIVARCDTVGAKLVAASQLLIDNAPAMDALAAPLVPLERLDATGGGLPQTLEPDPDELAFLQFTSGTTARSRAVVLTHRHLVANLRAAGRAADVDPSTDVFVSWLPLFHDMGLIGMLLGSMVFGTELVLQPTEEFLARPGSWVDAISAHRGTLTAAPNFGYGLAARDLKANDRDLDLSCWRIAANGAEPIDVSTVQRFIDVARPHGFDERAMCPMFGLAEATLAVALSRPDEPVHVEWVVRDDLERTGSVTWAEPGSDGARALVACGHPIPGHEVEIRDDDGRALAPGQVGEICVRGPSIMAGYWRDPASTAEALHDGWLHTGDLGYWGPNGLVVCGRLKDMIILGGRNLYPEDYEMHAEVVSGVRKGNVIAFALPDRERMVVVAETTVAREDADIVARSTLEALRTNLPRGPEEVVLVEPGTLPKTSSGKRQRAACREDYVAGRLSTVATAGR